MIIHITPAYKPAYIYGGPTISVARLCEELAAAKQEIIVLTTTANGPQELKIQTGKALPVNNVPVYYFKRLIRGQIHLSLQLLRQLNKELRKKDTVVHIHSWWNGTAMLSCMLGMIRGKRVVLSPRGMITAYSLNNRHFLLKWLIHKVIGNRLIKYCQIHVTSEKEEQDVLQIQPNSNTTVIANIPESLPIPAELKTVMVNIERDFNLLFFSRIEEKKGIELLFKALSELKIVWSLTMCGFGKEVYICKLKKMACELNIDKRIVWKGFIHNQKKHAVFNRHDLLVLFSKNENFGNVILESLSFGLPVCISKEVGLAHFVTQNDLGWVADLNIPSIKAALMAAYFGFDKRKTIFENAASIVCENFHPTTLLPQYIKLYNRL
ncbi:XrtY-associated glycosyltransferase XYAG1 [Pedobacter sp. PWIIR3]